MPCKKSRVFKNNDESRWGQPDGLCRKEEWPRRHMRAEALEGCPEVGLANDSGNCHLHYVIKNERRMPRFFGPVLDILLISIFAS